MTKAKASSVCAIESCDKAQQYLTLGFCDMHYRRKQRGQDMAAPPRGYGLIGTASQRHLKRHRDELNKRHRELGAADPERDRLYGRRHALKKRFGMTFADRAALFEESDGLCSLCYERVAVVIDHDHDTGRIRGALCNGCNAGLGMLGDNEEGLTRAIEYLTERMALDA